MHIGMTFTRLRTEERILLDAFDALGVQVTPIDLRECVFNPSDPEEWKQYDGIFDRSVSLTNSLTSIRMLEIFGIPCFNNSHAIQVCSDKLMTSAALIKNNIPTPQVRVALTATSGLRAVEEIGYPAVIKPTVGSWGRLVSRVRDQDAAEAVLEHRETLGSVQQRVIYIQEHIDKPGEDIRVFVVGGEAIAAISRSSKHWVTNTARGAEANGISVSHELGELSLRAVEAVGADIAAVDFLECPNQGLLVNEVNHSMEFKNSIETTGVNISGRVAEFVVQSIEKQTNNTGAAL